MVPWLLAKLLKKLGKVGKLGRLGKSAYSPNLPTFPTFYKSFWLGWPVVPSSDTPACIDVPWLLAKLKTFEKVREGR